MCLPGALKGLFWVPLEYSMFYEYTCIYIYLYVCVYVRINIHRYIYMHRSRGRLLLEIAKWAGFLTGEML